MKHARHIPVLQVSDLHDVIPWNCVPVAVDLVPEATPLPEYEHPERAFYVFGAEDQTLGARVLGWCRDVVYVPTAGCMNLSCAVNVVLYDRMVKRGEYDRVQQGGVSLPEVRGLLGGRGDTGEAGGVLPEVYRSDAMYS